jgi:hypothetical protein
MITNDIRYGGTLKIGDFIGIGDNYGMSFGWYCGNGRADNIQYITIESILYAHRDYLRLVETAKRTGIPLSKKDRDGFSLDHIGKHPVRNHKKDCVVKLTDSDSLFSGDKFINYEKAKLILTQIKLIGHDSRKASFK